MSDHLIQMQRQIDQLARELERLKTVERAAKIIPFAPHAAVGGAGLSSNNYMMATSCNRRLYLLKWVQSVLVSGTNNGSNYWMVQLDDGVTVFASFNTSAMSASTWTASEITSFTQPSSAPTFGWIGIQCVKTGTPGTLQWTNAELLAF